MNHIGVTEAVIATSGVSLKWVKNTLFSDKSYLEIDSMASDTNPGSGNVFFYPHLSGSTSPYWKSEAKGCIYGITLSTESGDVIRSVLEGISYQIRINLEVMEEMGIPINEIRVFGGGTKSVIWCKIIADITGKPVSTLYTAEAANLGAALIAAYGAGLYESPFGALSKISPVSHVYEPNSEINRLYNGYYLEYKAMQEKLLK